MKIALINPDNGKAIKKENLGLLGLATYLKSHGLDVRLIDEVAGDKTAQVLHAFSPDVVGVSFMTLFANRAAEITRHVRANHPRAKIVLGGAHPTACPEESAGLADAVITGEAESALLELLRKDSWTDKIIQGRYEQDLDILPIPDRGMINTEYYLAQRMGIAGLPLRTLSLSTSRGCPYRCIFCQNSKRTVPVRMHSIARVIQEIRLLTENHRVESLAFVDENFAFNRNRLAELCRAMIRENIRITWECQTSANLVDEEILSLAKQAGAIQIAFGFESGSQRILDTLGKKSTVEQNRSAITLVKKAGLKVRGCFMMGNPTETLVDIRLTQAFIKNNDIDYTGVFMATPYPGTELWDYCVSHKRIDPATVDFNTFTTGSEVAPCACAAVDAQVLKRLYAETVYLSMRKNYTWPRIALKFFRYPGEALRLIKSRIPGVTMENRPVTPAKRLVKTIPYAIAVVFALLFIRAVDWRHAFSLLRALDKFAVGAYLVFILVSYLLGAVKYGLIIRGSLPDRKTLYLYFMSKTSGSLTPGRIGDFIPLLSPDFRNKGVAMALFLDKILEFLMLLIFGCAGLAVLKNLPTGILQLWLSGGLACIVFLFLLRRNRFWRFLSAKIPADDDSSPHFRRLAGRAVAFIEKVSYETGMLGNHFYLLLGLTCLTYSLSAAASFVLFHACGLPVPLYMVFELIAVSGLVSLLSFTPSGIGPADLSVLYILQFYGMSAEAFGAYTVVTRTVNLSLLAVPYALLHWLGRKGDA